MKSNLKILCAEPNAARAHEIIGALKDGGWHDVTVVATSSELDAMIDQQNPDIILIDLANPDRDTLEHMSLIADARARPVAMFVDQSDEALTQAAISAGLSAYAVSYTHLTLPTTPYV